MLLEGHTWGPFKGWIDQMLHPTMEGKVPRGREVGIRVLRGAIPLLFVAHCQNQHLRGLSTPMPRHQSPS